MELAARGEESGRALFPPARSWGAEVASMANKLGGQVLLGVHDKTRKMEALDLAR
jgi:predicted HTH transcriptional regulator